jgi:hypothetical protein
MSETKKHVNENNTEATPAEYLTEPISRVIEKFINSGEINLKAQHSGTIYFMCKEIAEAILEERSASLSSIPKNDTGGERQRRALESDNIRLQQENERLKVELSDYQERDKDIKRLCREIDVIMFGEDGAAKQASLCDILKSVQDLKRESDKWYSEFKKVCEQNEIIREQGSRYKKAYDSMNDELSSLKKQSADFVRQSVAVLSGEELREAWHLFPDKGGAAEKLFAYLLHLSEKQSQLPQPPIK